jgi:peptidoglycan/LPS O-acetylase OafA/YrhL
MAMTPALSVWLDLCRVVAALAVYVGHSVHLKIAPTVLSSTWHRSADDAVTAFFVISGLVIAHTTRNHHDDPGRYALARLSRVYSVAIPAVLFVLAADLVGMRFDASVYNPDWQYPQAWLHVIFHWLFLGETWFGAVQPFTMAPYWSLGYEVWYYVLFGVFIFVKGWPRWLLVLATVCIMGPRIALLLPVWWLGVLLHGRLGGLRFGPGTARTLMLLAAVGYALFFMSGWRGATDLASRHLYAVFGQLGATPFDAGSTVHVLSDYVVALLFAIFVAGCMRCEWDFSGRPARMIRWLAGYTFTFYLIHFTLLVFAGAMGVEHPGWGGYLLVLSAVFAGTWLLAQVGEQRRGWYRSLFLHVWNFRPWAPSSVDGTK